MQVFDAGRVAVNEFLLFCIKTLESEHGYAAPRPAAVVHSSNWRRRRHGKLLVQSRSVFIVQFHQLLIFACETDCCCYVMKSLYFSAQGCQYGQYLVGLLTFLQIITCISEEIEPVTLKVICSDFLVVKVNCSLSGSNII